MLTEWLEKEASAGISKTAAAQFEEELAALSTEEVVEVYRKTKEAALPGALAVGIPSALAGAAGGAIQGGVIGGLGGAMGAPSGQRGEGFWEGAKKGVVPGAIGQAVGSGLGGAMIGHGANFAGRRALVPRETAAAGQALGLLGGLGGMAHAGVKGYEAGKSSKKKPSEGGDERVAALQQALEQERMRRMAAEQAVPVQEKTSSLKTPMLSRVGKRVGDVTGTTLVSALNLAAKKLSDRRARREALRRIAESK